MTLQAGGKPPAGVENWTKNCDIKTAKMLERDAAAVGGGIIVDRQGKWLWAPRVNEKEGVMIVHPLGPRKPAEVTFAFVGNATDRSKKIVIVARGSEKVPGVALKVIAKQKIVNEVALNQKWETIEIPLAETPLGTSSITLEIAPVLWAFEYCYLDII